MTAPSSPAVRGRTLPLTHRGPPAFQGAAVGEALTELQHLRSAWLVARTISARRFTQRLLLREPGFETLTGAELTAVADTLTFRLGHVQSWKLLWAESLDGPGRFSDVRTFRVGVSEETVRELARTIGLEAKASVSFLSAQAGTQWSRLTRSTISVHTESEFTRTIEYDIPAGGMDIALWQLESRLVRRLELRPGATLPPDPVPRWVELALATRPRTLTVPCAVIRVRTRKPEDAPEPLPS